MFNDEEHWKILQKTVNGEEIFQEEKDHLRERIIRYELIRFLYTQKVNHNSENKLTDFHFTPGDNFMETPIYDVLHELVKWHEGIKDGSIKVTPLDFGDSNWKEAPQSNKEKSTL